MPKRSQALDAMPPLVLAQLRTLGEHLAIARKRRLASRKDWALRIGVTEPTLARMERGDPSVSMAAYATALWLIGRSSELAEIAAPVHDLGALENEVRAAQWRAVRKPPSIARRLAGAGGKGDA
ncbi:XRE family transcriptional regulator [Roseateles sp. LYH14W]|uniref:XRE family transcriptional regulator n=1 Tax=Pelomonas parva TaxID=3299032 RepID=A0ABW7F1I8_9BURK